MTHQVNSPFPSKQIYLNSEHGTLTNTGGHRFNFSDTMNIPTNYSFLCSMVDAQIPYSFYSISQARQNDHLEIQELTPSVEDPVIFHNVTVADGNYSIYQLIDAIQLQLPNQYSITYNELKNTLSITITNSNSFKLVDNNHTLLEKTLGFTENDGLSYVTTLTGSGMVNLSGIAGVYVRTNLVTSNLDSRTGGSSNIIAKIPILSPPHGYIQYENVNGHKTRLREKNISHIEVHLEDENGMVLDLNGQHWQMTIQLDVYKPPKLIRTKAHRNIDLKALEEFQDE